MSGHNVNQCPDPHIEMLHMACLAHTNIVSCIQGMNTVSILGLAGKYQFPSRWGIGGKRTALTIMYIVLHYIPMMTSMETTLVSSMKSFMTAILRSVQMREASPYELAYQFSLKIVSQPQYARYLPEIENMLREIQRQNDDGQDREERRRQYSQQRMMEHQWQLQIVDDFNLLNLEHTQLLNRINDLTENSVEVDFQQHYELWTRNRDIDERFMELQIRQSELNAITVQRQGEYLEAIAQTVNNRAYTRILLENRMYPSSIKIRTYTEKPAIFCNENRECPICYDSQTETATNCKHTFCSSCIQQALQCTRNTCPICRQSITELIVSKEKESVFAVDNIRVLAEVAETINPHEEEIFIV